VASLCPLNATLALAACLLWSPGARAGCPEPVTVAVLDGTVGLAEQSAGRDAQAFGDAVHALRDQLPCLEAVVSPSLAARLHRVEGLQAFVDGAGERALMAFAASNRLDPDYRFPATLFPQAHPVARLWARSCDLEWGWNSAAGSAPTVSQVWLSWCATMGWWPPPTSGPRTIYPWLPPSRLRWRSSILPGPRLATASRFPPSAGLMCPWASALG
jgi:hypothetical protein